MFRYFKSNKKYNNLEITGEQDLNNIILESIIQVSKLYPKVKILSPANLSFIKEEIKWIKACNYNELEVYQNIDRLGRI